MNNFSPSPTPFCQTEEAFFLNCVSEVRKIWASKSGQAKLDIFVKNGIADLQLNFQLGPPENPHIPHHPYNNQNPHRYKTPARLAKDRARAAAHQRDQLLRSSPKSNDSTLNYPPLLPKPTSPFHQADPASPSHPNRGAVPALTQQLSVQPLPLHRAAPAPTQILFQAATASSKHRASPVLHEHQADPAISHHQDAPALTQYQAHNAPFKQDAPALPHHQEHPADKATSPNQDQVAEAHCQQVQTSNPSQVHPRSQPPPEQKPVISEETRKINRLYDKADRISMGFTMHNKIAHSNCQHEIEDSFWKILREKPLEYFNGNKIDEEKVRQTYKSAARSLGVRIY